MSAVKHRAEKDCLNCGHVVEDKFCSHCGQENLVVKEKAWAMVTHAIADYFHFEHKFFSTMRPLLLKPGQLTKEYVAGKRASFIHPIRLYIFVSIVFFLVVLTYKSSDEKTENNVNVKTKKESAKKSLTKTQQKKVQDSVVKAKIKEGMKYVPMDAKDREKLNKELDSNSLDDKDSNDFVVGYNPGKPNLDYVYPSDTTYEAYLERTSKLPVDQRPGTVMKYMAKSQIKFRGRDGQKRFVESLLHNVPKMMFILLPLFAAMLHIAYIRKRRYYYEDLIYSFHLHSSIFLSILVFKLINWLISYVIDIQGWLVFLLVIYIIWYIYRSLRVFYNSSRWRTVIKLFFLSFAYLFVLMVALMVIVSYTVIAL